MVDDEDSKVRRNLVALSAAVLLSAWLDFPLISLVARLVGDKPDGTVFSPAPWKVWMALLALWSYCMLRYFFSEEFEKRRAAISTLQAVRYTWWFRRHMRSLARRIEANRFPDPEQREELASLVKRAAESVNIGDQPSARKLSVSIPEYAPGGVVNAGTDHYLRIALEWSRAEHPQLLGAATEVNYRYSMPRALNLRYVRVAWLSACLLSRPGLSHIWPVGLAMAAVSVILFKLLRPLF